MLRKRKIGNDKMRSTSSGYHLKLIFFFVQIDAVVFRQKLFAVTIYHRRFPDSNRLAS